ncbi:MAG: CoA transferase [Chloroflexi bacterium]|nr:CoA transferase [Chloroflexota bacterium]
MMQPVAGLGRALDGFKVVEFGHIVAGPLCAMYLADMGADVVKVEPPTGDHIRDQGVVFVAGENPSYFSVNRNKRGIVLDLRQPEGVEIARRLAAGADVLIENYRPGALQRLGLGYDTLRELNPRLVYCSVSGFGSTGPYAGRPAVDPILQAMAGVMGMTGEPGHSPVLVGAPIVDLYAAALAAYGVVVALLARSRTGLGQRLEVALMNAGLYLLLPREGPYWATGKSPQPSGSAHRQVAPYQVFRTADGFIFIAVRSDDDWRRFCELLGATELYADERFRTNRDRVTHRDDLLAALEPILVTWSTEELWAALDRIDVVCGPVQTFEQVFRDPQVLHNQMVVTLEHPAAGPINVLGVPVKLHGTPGQVLMPPPTLGEHTDEVLAELGCTPEEVAGLRARGVTVARRKAKGTVDGGDGVRVPRAEWADGGRRTDAVTR